MTNESKDSKQVQADAGAVPAGLLDALRFYANGSHFTMHDSSAWDTVSGEPPNFYEDESNTATVEDGSIAKLALQGKFFTDQEYTEPPVEGEVFGVMSPAAESDKRDAEHADIGRLLHKAASTLPEGYEIQVLVEHGWAGVGMRYPDDVVLVDFDDGESSLSEQIERAIRAAMSREQSGGYRG